ncbi:MAG: DUF1592 domain-containing protein [Planctomycetota bacterium]
MLVFTLVGVPGVIVAQENTDGQPQRVGNGLQSLYNFNAPRGGIVKDRSGVGDPVDLTITNLDNVRRRVGALEVRGETLIRSDGPARKITDAVRQSGAITIEAWINPANTTQAGPARIITLSKNGSERNFTLGQESRKYDVRLRTTNTSTNGIPSLATQNRTLNRGVVHVTYTRDRSGRSRIYLDGKRVSEKTMPGKMSNWDRGHRLALANEHSKGRQWLGTYYLIAIYSRALSPAEVDQNYKAGPGASTASPLEVAVAGPPPKETHFETVIAPLLAKHCLECHDSANAKGKLDLSLKTAAFKGGKEGLAIVPGKPLESLLWDSIDFDDMPKDRDPLPADEKKLLHDWIADGATWSMDRIDPASYLNEGGGKGNFLRRLTVAEYIQTVRDAVGVDISKEARELLPPDLRADGFSNTAYNLSVDLGHINAYAQLARTIVERMDVDAFADRFYKKRNFTDDDMGKLIVAMGKWLLRGPIEDTELFAYRGISTTIASAGGDMDEAVSYIVEAMLQSPRFIYRVENQRGDGTDWPVTEYELASRMSYIIWGGPPDRELMRVADNGDLYDPRRVKAQAKRLLDDPRAVEQSLRFADQWLHLGRMDSLSPSAEMFPDWDPTLADDMRQETLAYFKEVVWNQKRPLADLLNAQVTFVTPRLARHYGLTPQGRGLQRYDLTDVPERGGLLTHGSVLTVGGDDASMVTRGLFVMRDLLRGVVKDPPPGLDVSPEPAEPGLSRRGISMDRVANDSCGGCHIRFEPLAYSLEKFNGIGAHHDFDEHGNKQREDGEVLFPGDAKPTGYKTTAELMDLLADSDRVALTLTWKLTQFAIGRPLGAADVRTIEKIHEAATAGGGTYPALMTAIVMSDLVQTTRTEPSE